VLVVVGTSNNTLGVSPFLFYFLSILKHINLIDANLKDYLVAALPRWVHLCPYKSFLIFRCLTAFFAAVKTKKNP